MFKIRKPVKKNKTFIENFFIKKGLEVLFDNKIKKNKSINSMVFNEPHEPEVNDLYNLYQFIILNKRTTVLEFGSGWSSLIINLALLELKKKYSKNIENLRRNNPFELFITENSTKYLNISKKRIDKYNKKQRVKDRPKIHYKLSKVKMSLFNNKIVTEYKNLPLCNPDFIYIDGPDQFNVIGNINGISTSHKDMLPMSCDVLKLEYFFNQGTIILIDGRSANAKFLKDNFKRKWKYINDKVNDQHIFFLNDNNLSRINKLQLDFYNDI